MGLLNQLLDDSPLPPSSSSASSAGEEEGHSSFEISPILSRHPPTPESHHPPPPATTTTSTESAAYTDGWQDIWIESTYATGIDGGELERLPVMIERDSSVVGVGNQSRRFEWERPRFERVPVSQRRSSCEEYKRDGYVISGVYEVKLGGNVFEVMCLMEQDYGWTVLQRWVQGVGGRDVFLNF